MSIVLRMLLVTAAAAFAGTSHAVLVARYEFNETSGDISSAVNTGVPGSIAPWGADPDTTLSGGNLVVNGQLNFQPGSPSFGGILQGPNVITSGSAFLRIDFASWGSSANPFFVFGLRASGPGTPAGTGWRLQFSSGDSSDSNPLGRLQENAGFSFLRTPTSGTESARILDSTIPAAGGLMPNGFSVIMGVSLDSDRSSIWWDPGRTGFYVFLGSRNNDLINSSGGFTNFSQIDAIVLQTGTTTTPGSFAVDRLVLGTDFVEIAAIPEPSLVAALGAISVAMVLASRRGSGKTKTKSAPG